MQIKRYAEGFTYLAVLFIVALMGCGLYLTGQLWQKTIQQEKERQLLFVGDQFRRAILLYYERSPGGQKKYPKDFEALIKDERYVSTQRYLREVYQDPLSGTRDWGIIKSPDGGIMGVYSLSTLKPLKTAGFTERYAQFANRPSFADWKFIYQPIPTIGILPKNGN